MFVFIIFHSLTVLSILPAFISLIRLFLRLGSSFPFPVQIYIQLAIMIIRLAFTIFIMIKTLQIIKSRPFDGQTGIIRLLKMLFLVESIYRAVWMVSQLYDGSQALRLINILPYIVGYWLRYFIWKSYFEKSEKVHQYFTNE